MGERGLTIALAMALASFGLAGGARATEPSGRGGDTLVAANERDRVNPGNEAGEAAHEAGEVVSDAWITTKIKGQLATARPAATSIDVDTKNNVVTLSGRVDSEAMRERAVSIARTTEGVKEVNDKLVVKSAAK